MEKSVEQLVNEARQGRPAALGELVGRFERTALAVAYGILGDPEAAGEAVQEGFVRAWQKLGDLAEPSRFPAWLCGIVRNLSLDALRRAGRRKSVGLEQADGDAAGQRWVVDPAEEAGRREQHQRVADALAEMDELSRMCLSLRYYQQLSSREIAETLDLTAAAVDMRLSRARQQLRQKLTDPAECKMGEP